MCIAIAVQAGKKLDSEWLYNSFAYNGDGGGIAYIKDGQVCISKGHMKYEDLQAAYNMLYDLYGKDNPMLVHCRIATAGKVNSDNCHPFRIKNGALIHNGHLWSPEGGWEAEMSDTREFAAKFHNILTYDEVSKAIADESFVKAIGYDKMAFLYDNSAVLLAGHWVHEDGASFSNSDYKRSGSSYAAACGYDFDDYDNFWRYGV